MTTALQIVNAVAERLGVKTAEIPLEAVDFQVILSELNDMLSEWADSNITPTFNEVSNSTDTVNIERDAVGAVKSNLAVRVAPIFGRMVTPALAESASTTRRRLLANVVNIRPVAFPDTLPIGSGNECFDNSARFFDANKQENF
jgi:hypothetical protein